MDKHAKHSDGKVDYTANGPIRQGDPKLVKLHDRGLGCLITVIVVVVVVIAIYAKSQGIF